MGITKACKDLRCRSCPNPDNCEHACHSTQQREAAQTAPPPDPGVVWEDPPARGKEEERLRQVRAVVPTLKRNPGRWARVVDYPGATGASSALGKFRAQFPDLELRGARVGTGSAIYARFVEA